MHCRPSPAKFPCSLAESYTPTRARTGNRSITPRLIAASDRKLMQGQPSSWLSRIVVGFVMLGMFGAAAAMFFL